MRRIPRATATREPRDVGASAIEYSLLVVAIAAIVVLVVFALGKFSQETYNDTCDAFAGQPDPPAGISCP